LLALRSEIGCDLYWPRDQDFEAGVCSHCGIPEACLISELRWHIGGELRAAEWQARYSIYGPPPGLAAKFSPNAADYSPRLDSNLEAVYFKALDCLQFSSDFWPCSDSIAEVSPEALLSSFLDVLERHVAPFLGNGQTKAELTVSMVERGDFQGSAGLVFDTGLLE